MLGVNGPLDGIQDTLHSMQKAIQWHSIPVQLGASVEAGFAGGGLSVGMLTGEYTVLGLCV